MMERADAVSTNFRTLDLNLLRVFDAVMAERHLTRAAGQLAMTQPAVSNALRRLREALNDELLTRTPGGMKPTRKAEQLWPQVRAALDQLRQAMAPGDYDPQQHERTFHLAMADVTAATLMPTIVRGIEAGQVRANLRLTALTTRDPRALLEGGDIDMALGYFPATVMALAEQGQQATLRHQHLYESEYVCVMRQGHPLAAEGALTLDAYCAAHHLLVSFSGRAQGYVDEALAALKRSRRVVLTVNQFSSASRVVAESDLLTVQPGTFVLASGYGDRLVARPLPLRVAPVRVEAVWHARVEQDGAHRWLRERIFEAAASAMAA
jgi:DNA-binding transcriptional LysR family regulator